MTLIENTEVEHHQHNTMGRLVERGFIVLLTIIGATLSVIGSLMISNYSDIKVDVKALTASVDTLQTEIAVFNSTSKQEIGDINSLQSFEQKNSQAIQKVDIRVTHLEDWASSRAEDPFTNYDERQ